MAPLVSNNVFKQLVGLVSFEIPHGILEDNCELLVQLGAIWLILNCPVSAEQVLTEVN